MLVLTRIKTQGNSNKLIVSLYVDASIYTRNNEKMIQEFKEEIMKTLEVTNLDLMHYSLKLKIDRNQKNFI